MMPLRPLTFATAGTILAIVVACTPVAPINALTCTGTRICDAACLDNNRSYTVTFDDTGDARIESAGVSGPLFLQSEDVAITDTEGTMRFGYPSDTGPAGMDLRLGSAAITMVLFIGNSGPTHYATCTRQEAV